MGEHRSASPSGGSYMRVCLELGLPMCLHFATCTLHLKEKNHLHTGKA